MTLYITPPPGNPLIRVLTAIAGLLVVAGAFMLGIVTLAIVVGIGLLVWLGIWLRVLWGGHRRRHRGEPGPGAGRPDPDQVIETEYTVVSRRQDP